MLLLLLTLLLLQRLLFFVLLYLSVLALSACSAGGYRFWPLDLIPLNHCNHPTPLKQPVPTRAQDRGGVCDYLPP
eukprot:520771-Hanusia_phi.AAC.3